MYLGLNHTWNDEEKDKTAIVSKISPMNDWIVYG